MKEDKEVHKFTMLIFEIMHEMSNSNFNNVPIKYSVSDEFISDDFIPGIVYIIITGKDQLFHIYNYIISLFPSI